MQKFMFLLQFYQQKIFSKLEERNQNNYLDYIIDLSFQGVNILFALSFENITDRKVNTRYYIPKVEIKD